MTDPTGEPIADRPDDAAAPDAAAPDAAAPDAGPDPAGPGAPRPALERIGLAAIAVVMAVLFGGVAVAAFAGGEYFLAAMSAVGCMMTLVVGGSTLLRG
ncbi:MAG TPA: hypothetical protein VFO78_06045 [Candidatus Limnocylindrales bacterium]|nr:hypothetical protein [Candidatus Limnocylindrales bacterium]